MRLYLQMSGQKEVDLLHRVLTVSRWANEEKLTILQRRQLQGCLCRVPNRFYSLVWDILTRTPEGIRVQGHVLPAGPTLTTMSHSELAFSLLVEETLIWIKPPERKQFSVELICIVATILSRNPELRFQKKNIRY